jgi:DNA-binding Xre family transcriptional regulator
MQKISGTIAYYQFLKNLAAQWKPRAKKAKINLKEIAVQAGITPQYFTKIITGKVENPRLQTINDIEIALLCAELKAGVLNG